MNKKHAISTESVFAICDSINIKGELTNNNAAIKP